MNWKVALQFSSGWLQKFKDRNGIRLRKLEGEAMSADENAISNAFPITPSTKYIIWTKQAYFTGR